MQKGSKNRGINVEKINYQENGNWAYQKGMNPEFHIHYRNRGNVGIIAFETNIYND